MDGANQNSCQNSPNSRPCENLLANFFTSALLNIKLVTCRKKRIFFGTNSRNQRVFSHKISFFKTGKNNVYLNENKKQLCSP